MSASGVKPGRPLRKSELSNFTFSSILPVRNPLPERTIWHEADAEFFERWYDFLFRRLSCPERILALKSSQRLDSVCATDRLHACFGKAEVLHLPLLNQFLHRAGDIFDRHVRVNAVLIEQVDARRS